MTKPSARQIAQRSAILPALAAALIPKCPFCVAAYLSLLGMSSAAAGTIAPVVRAGLLVIAWIAIALILLPLGRLALRSRDHAPLLVVTATACAALALSVAGAPLPLRIAALLALLVAWLWAERRLRRAARSESCCASKLQGSTTTDSA
jgi:hypothetical protein